MTGGCLFGWWECISAGGVWRGFRWVGSGGRWWVWLAVPAEVASLVARGVGVSSPVARSKEYGCRCLVFVVMGSGGWLGWPVVVGVCLAELVR